MNVTVHISFVLITKSDASKTSTLLVTSCFIRVAMANSSLTQLMVAFTKLVQDYC